MKNHAMRVLLSGCLLLMFTQCAPQRSVYRGKTHIGRYEVVEIEGCEYIYGRLENVFTHKGNCKNPVHRCD
jgi:hypothetical protein